MIADALRAEAERILTEATDDHGRLVDVGLGSSPSCHGTATSHSDS